MALLLPSSCSFHVVPMVKPPQRLDVLKLAPFLPTLITHTPLETSAERLQDT